MFFDWNWKIYGFLFENFNIDTIWLCLVIIFIVFVLALLSEGIKVLQKVLTKFFTGSETGELSPHEDSPLLHISVEEKRLRVKRNRLINHVIQTILYMTNLTIGYFLMNISMCYYSGHMIAIVIGFGVGYYLLFAASPDFEKSVGISCPCPSNKESPRHSQKRDSPENVPTTSTADTYDEL